MSVRVCLRGGGWESGHLVVHLLVWLPDPLAPLSLHRAFYPSLFLLSCLPAVIAVVVVVCTSPHTHTYTRLLGEASGVPIEPPVQTELLDATSEVRGVVAAGVPGAGGFDAIFCVFIGVDGVDSRVEDCWLSWKKGEGNSEDARAAGGLTPLLLRNGPSRDAPGAGAVVSFS